MRRIESCGVQTPPIALADFVGDQENALLGIVIEYDAVLARSRIVLVCLN